MTQQKKSYHHGDLRNALITVAAQMIEQGGVEGFSLREAARKVGVTTNAAYRHFSDRSALLTAIAKHGFEALSARMQAARGTSSSPPHDREEVIRQLRGVARAYIDHALENPQIFRLMYGANGLSCITGIRFLEGPTPGEVLVDVLDTMVSVGAMSAHRRIGAELSAWAAVHGLACLMLDSRTGATTNKERKQAIVRIIDMVLSGLCIKDSESEMIA